MVSRSAALVSVIVTSHTRQRLGDVFELLRSLKSQTHPNVEVISLLTHPTLREPVVKAAAAAGKPILTEKPLANNMEECERMVAIAADAKIPFAVSQNYRWAGTNFLAHHIVKKGLIGQPFYASIEIQGRQDVELDGHPFYSKCESFLTIQWNNHLADLLRYWLGADAKRVEYSSVTDEEALAAFHELTRLEGILPALEPSHALAETRKRAGAMGADKVIVVCLSGRGDKDVESVLKLADLGARSAEQQ